MARRGIGQEDRMHMDFGLLIRQYEGYKKLNATRWTYIASGEKRNLATAAMLKKKGVKPAWPDYIFIKSDKNGINSKTVFLEFKTTEGKQSKEQKQFEQDFDGCQNVRYWLVRSVKEGVEALEQEGILITD